MSHKFSKGLGALTAARLSNWSEAVDRVDFQADVWSFPAPIVQPYGPIFCKVISSTRMATTGANKWKWLYRLQEIKFDDSTPTITSVTDYFDTETDRAVNLAEQSNTETVVSGISVGDLPGNFELQPIPNGSFVMTWVLALSDDDEDSIPIFERPGEFDGDCT
tara:strand:- start:170 stop:658 length:489 start_codon:yes stop_codon:yes gene_type:complete